MKFTSPSLPCLAIVFIFLLAVATFASGQEKKNGSLNPPIYIAFLWHMHQPIYWPYETVVQTDQNSRYPYSVVDIHNQRTGPYTSWPKNAVQKGITANLAHLGAQVSFSGSLIENLNNLELAGNGNFQNWKSNWNSIKTQNTTLGNPRLDMVGFGYHHPLMGLIDYTDIRKQLQAHKQIMSINFSGTYSKGIFPPENAFTPRMIPALVAEGIQWALVDNVHFDRACDGYPFNTSGNLYEPNKSDIRNPNPNDWIQMNGLWAPTKTSARWGRQPHYVEYTDPSTGLSSKMIAVPADRYMGNEDGRGGFGALNYDAVMSQLEPYNTDPNHPILIVLHHDGDNYGGGSESYYNNNFQSFVNWLLANPTRFVCTTVEDFLEMYPPDANDVIHIENGSWSGADNGDPEFKKWLGDPDGAGYSPDQNSWGVATAARNYVATADQIDSGSTNTQNAWKYMLNAEASDYWYWDGSQNGIWDSHPTRAGNQAVQYAQPVVNSGTDLTGPTIFQPQREPYNPGATEWGINQTNNVTMWSYVYDLHGLKSVTLKYRTDLDGVNPPSSTDNETYTGGSEVSAWIDSAMTGTVRTSTTNPLPIVKARYYSTQLSGMNNLLVDYYIEAVDSLDNLSRSPIQHVWIGPNSGGGGGGGGVSWVPVTPTNNDSITISVGGATQGAKLHWGVNNIGSSWQTPNAAYRPAGSTLFNGTGPAVESPMDGPDSSGNLTIKLGPFNNPAQTISKVAFVVHYTDNSWDNNSGQDYHITLPDTTVQQTFVMDGQLDASAGLVSSSAGVNLYLGWNSGNLYVATQSAQQQGGDIFVFVADSPRAVINAPWAKAGTVAAWGAFLGNESGNNWNGWFDQSSTVLNTAGAILEGTIDIQSEFGHIPAKLYVAVGKYQTADGGSLSAQTPAGNGNGNIEPAELYEFDYTFPGVLPPAPPALSVPPDGALNQPVTLTLQWLASSGASGYHVQASAESVFATTLLNDSTATGLSRQLSSLNRSTSYYWRVRAKNAGGWGLWSVRRSFTTGAPVFTMAADSVAFGDVNVGFLKRDSVTVSNTGVMILSVDSVRSSGAEFTVSPSGGTVAPGGSRTFTIRFVPASEGAKTGTMTFYHDAPGSPQVVQLTGAGIVDPTVQVTVLVDASWNMLSVPLTMANDSVARIFPGTNSQAFSFAQAGGYQMQATLRNGVGYWLKFDSARTIQLSGLPRTTDTVHVNTGWNLIGSTMAPVSVSSIIQIPPGIVVSGYYGFSNGYGLRSTLVPGCGYWVKVSPGGKLVLPSSAEQPATVQAPSPVRIRRD